MHLSTTPGSYSRLIVTDDFESGTELEPDEVDPPASETTDALEFKPNGVNLLADTVAAAAERGRVRYEASDGSYWIEAQPVGERGIRFVLLLHDALAPNVHSFDLKLPSGLQLISGKKGTGIIVRDSASPTDAPVAVVGAPFAYDANGREIPVQQTITGNQIQLQLDLADPEIKFPVLADPPLYRQKCWQTTLEADTGPYLGAGISYGLPPHSGVCPYGMTFWDASFDETDETAEPYWPMVAPICSGCSERTVNHVGDRCSVVPDENGSFYDFTVPCMMHDHGYDLIRIKRHWNYDQVDKGEVDSEFRDAMHESCDPKPALDEFYCDWIAEDYYWGVAFFGSPDAESRPLQWPTGGYQFLQNTYFNNGTQDWVVASSGGDVAFGVYDLGGEKYLAYRCKNHSGCSLRQTQGISLYGGESLHGQFWIRCKPKTGTQPSTCPLTFQVRVMDMDGNWETVKEVATTAPTPFGTDGWAVISANVSIPTSTQGGKIYKKIRFRIRNDGTHDRLDMIRPLLLLQAS